MKNPSRSALPLVLLCLVPVAPAHADDPASASTSAPAGVPHVVITGHRDPEEAYKASTVSSLGPLGSTPILDTPYSIGVLTEDLIENSQAVNFKDVSKYLPLVSYQEQQGPDILRPSTRGMQGGNFQNSRIDGMTVFITVATAIEQFQQIEVVNGVTSSLYGPANPSGMFNFVSKRPTDYPLHEVIGTYTSDTIFTGKVDFGGKIDPNGIFGYRFNALFGEGDGFVDGSHQRRALGDLGIDVHPWEHGVLELNYSDYALTTTGYPGWFTYGEKILLPGAPDPTRVGYGQSYAGVDMRTKVMSARFKQELNSNWRLVLGVLNQDAARDINTPVNNLTDSHGDYTSSFANGFAPRFVITSDSGYLNGTFDTLGVSHDLTLGTAGYKARSFSVQKPATPASVLLGKASIDNPLVFPEPAAGPPNVLANFDSSDTYQQGVNLSDTVRFDRHWSIRAGVSQDWFQVKTYNVKGLQTTEYTNHGASPTGSLMFNPIDTMMVYFTYASSLQAGDLAPGTAANAGTSLPPYRSKEYEVGFKAALGKYNFTAALFRIDRPFANIDPADQVFKISGQQVNKGLELSAIGEILPGLTAYGGLTLLDARLEHTPLASTNDQRYVGAPKVKGNILLEYQIPRVTGLVGTFDYAFAGTRAGNDTNSFTVSGYNVFDLGARYGTKAFDTAVTLRLAVDNVTGKRYWSTISPSNLTGTNTGSLLAHLGAPRTVLASLSIDF